MGRILKIDRLKTPMEVLLIVVVLVGAVIGLMYWDPANIGLSKMVKGIAVSSETLDNVTKGDKLPVASNNVSSKVSTQPLYRFGGYPWNGNSGLLAAIGGEKTMEGSLMEAKNLNVAFKPDNMVDNLRDMLVLFATELDAGVAHPTNEKSAWAVNIMGDGVPFFIATLQQALDKKFGAGKYHAVTIAPIGLSYGEDKLIGPLAWKANPQLMRGSLISSVIGDGDWVILVNFAAINGIPINTDQTTYDAKAINVINSLDGDYINSAKELIAGKTVELNVVENGVLTGKKINKKVDGATTWTPGDDMIYKAMSGMTDIISTKEFNNQMATSIITIKEFAVANEKDVKAILSSIYIANNQIKQYDEWAVRASEAACSTFKYETPAYWYKMFKGFSETKDGVPYSVGGTKVFNYADALQYVGLGTDGINRYKAIYDQVGGYLVDLNPCDFNGLVKSGVVPFGDATNYYFLTQIKNDVYGGTETKVDYNVTKTTVLGARHWNIHFRTGSAQIEGSDKDLETIYNLLVNAESAKVKIIGYTDNTGNRGANVQLSDGRAKAVASYLTNRGIPSNKFQLVEGRGDAEPIGDNGSDSGRAQNRRVDIVLLQ